ncbi:MAG: MGMT family protein [Chloroflexota bacterium]|nr:MGMT family protein [Anaerolineales bacterium]
MFDTRLYLPDNSINDEFADIGMMKMSTQPNFYEQVYAIVRRIPQGKVTSYGRIAAMLGRPNAARAVGYALNALKERQEHDVPWQRVVNSQGRISIVNREHGANVQAEILQSEGVPVSDDLRVEMRLYLWEGLNLMELDDILRGG